MAYRTFHDFISARGENVIHTWLHSKAVPKEARAEINLQIELLKNVLNLERPAVGKLHGPECQGLIEIRVKVRGVQYRPLGYYGPADGQVTLLIGAKEKGGRLEPRTACTTAHERIRQLETGRASTREHDVS